jgi:glycosyltransferase involved in cell wall biosynthesis/Tfp pilus assembly protein PilF/predicted O-methyltransferase YrrM
MIRAFSIIVPVLNLETLIVRTLQSIEDSIAFFQVQYDGDQPVVPEVVVVNEGSSDRTLEIITEFAQDKPHYKILNHYRSLGAGPARNTGVRASQGDILFFCDGDDLFYPEHIYLCFQMLQDRSVDGPKQFQMRSDRGIQSVDFPPYPVGIVRTGVHMQDVLHPHWKEAVENTLPLNLCIRRECHEFVEGFPEGHVYKKIGCEDIGYDFWIYRFFRLAKINVETVEYMRYPGNSLERQLAKFQSAPEDHQEELSPEIQQLHGVRQKLEQEKLVYLLNKFTTVEKSAALLTVLNWQQLASEYFNQQNFQAAIQLFEQGIQREPQALNAVKNSLAIAYNNLGSALHQQRNLLPATESFQKSLAVNPDFSPADLAKVYFNLATVLRDQGELASALQALQKSLALEPQFPQAVSLEPSLNYQVQVAQRGYQFTEDWFSHNIPIWQQVLGRFVALPDLNALEVGSWEGRSTCWMLDNLLTDESARLTCIDTFAGAVEHQVKYEQTFLDTIEQRFDFNVARTGSSTKVTKQVGPSRELLRSQPLHAYDLAYIDGSHIAADVLEDALLAWALVKVGGILIFDDYGFQFQEGIDEQPPKVAIDAFLAIYGKKVKILHQGYQMMLEKLEA